VTKDHLPNYLRTHRKRVRLFQHQVAHLVGARSGAKISRYEHYTRIPDLCTVFALEIIYRTPAKVLFAGMFEKTRRLVHDRAERALRGNDAVLASFARQILDSSVGQTAKKPRTTFS
jgi:transcriptional regulator with XRE-family HTH domain